MYLVKKKKNHVYWFIVIVQLLSHVCPCVTPWTAAHQAFLCFAVSQSLPTLMSTGASHVALVVKNPADDAGDRTDAGSIPGLGRSPGEEHGSPLQCSCLENPHGHRRLAGCSP